MDIEFGWFTLSLVLIAYLFFASFKRGLLIKDKELGAWCELYVSLSKSSLVSLNIILLSWRLIQNIFLILSDNPED